MIVYDVVFALASVCFLLPIYAEMFEEISIQQFRSTLPPDTRYFDTFDIVWYNKGKYVVVNDHRDYLWLYKLNSFINPIKVDSRLVKQVLYARRDCAN